MTTLHQFSQVNCPIGATNIAIGSALLATDLLVAVSVSGQGGGRSITFSGFGTWSNGANLNGALAAPAMRVHQLTGVTGTGNVTVTVVGEAARVSLWVIRGLVIPAVFATQCGSSLGTVGTAFSPAPLTFAESSQAVLTVLGTAFNGGPCTFPDTSAVPSAGAWTVDGATAGTAWTAYAASVLSPASGTTAYQGAITRTSGLATSFAGVTLTLGEPATNVAVVSSESVETLTRGTPEAVLDSEYTELVTVGTPEAVLDSEYVEVMTQIADVAHVQAEYVEVMTLVAETVHVIREYVEVLTPALLDLSDPAFRGWGVPMKIA